MEKNKSLLQALKSYAASSYYPFHMPGHKRRAEKNGMEFPNPFDIDITEIYGFDNLHQPEGIIKESMEWAAGCYGADESWYLVNGSSCGILSAICGCTKRGGKILISRNCHKSVYNGIFLNQLQTEYVYPQIIEELGIQGGILPEDVEKVLRNNPDIQAVLIVSPTYDGMVSDIKRIAEIAHRQKIPLIVDEAHGAHFPFGKEGEFPKSALAQGADVVIQSLHKTLPSLTQTAILHIKKGYLNQDVIFRIRRCLSIFQSSSPSYVFMAAIENSIRYMEQDGKRRMQEFSGELTQFYDSLKNMEQMKIPGTEWIGKSGIYDKDRSKIIMVPGFLKSGVWLEEFLRNEFYLELEMCGPQYGLALTSLWDSKEGLERLKKGLAAADRKLKEEKEKMEKSKEEEQKIRKIIKDKEHPGVCCSIAEAMEMPFEPRRLEECEGKTAASFVYLYPPGIPALIPGEIISHEMIEKLIQYKKMGLTVQGIQDRNGLFLNTLS